MPTQPKENVASCSTSEPMYGLGETANSNRHLTATNAEPDVLNILSLMFTITRRLGCLFNFSDKETGLNKICNLPKHNKKRC